MSKGSKEQKRILNQNPPQARPQAKVKAKTQPLGTQLLGDDYATKRRIPGREPKGRKPIYEVRNSTKKMCTNILCKEQALDGEIFCHEHLIASQYENEPAHRPQADFGETHVRSDYLNPLINHGPSTSGNDGRIVRVGMSDYIRLIGGRCAYRGCVFDADSDSCLCRHHKRMRELEQFATHESKFKKAHRARRFVDSQS